MNLFWNLQIINLEFQFFLVFRRIGSSEGTRTKSSRRHPQADRKLNKFQNPFNHFIVIHSRIEYAQKENPYLEGDKLPIAAKKGFNVAA